MGNSHLRKVSVSESNVLLDEEVLTDPKIQALLLTVLVRTIADRFIFNRAVKQLFFESQLKLCVNRETQISMQGLTSRLLQFRVIPFNKINCTSSILTWQQIHSGSSIQHFPRFCAYTSKSKLHIRFGAFHCAPVAGSRQLMNHMEREPEGVVLNATAASHVQHWLSCCGTFASSVNPAPLLKSILKKTKTYY